MSDNRRASILDLIRGRSGKEKDVKRDANNLERQPSIAGHPNDSEIQKKPSPDKESKQRKPVERRESSRLQSAAKLLRSLSKTKDVSKTESPSKVTKTEEPPELPARTHPAYLSEGKGSRKRKNSGKENKESKGKDRSHSFHGKLDKKERKYVALERKYSSETKKHNESSGSSCSSVNTSQCHREETVVQGARSILLTEDNLIPINPTISPDLIQDLPKNKELSSLIQNIGNKRSDADNGLTKINDNDDDDYVEADTVARDVSDDISDKDGISPSGQFSSNKESGHKINEHREPSNTKDTRLVQTHNDNGYKDDNSGYVRRNQVFSQTSENYSNVPPSSSAYDYDPTYASIDEYQQQQQQQHSFLHNNNTNGWTSLNNSGLDDDYTNNLRSSSYAMLKPASDGPKSLMPHQDSRFHLSTTTPSSLFQSLPYIGSNQQAVMLGEEVTELEEYARQYEVTGRASRGARATPAGGRDSVMTITSSCQGRDSVISGSVQSDSSGETLRPAPSCASSTSSSYSPVNTNNKQELSDNVHNLNRNNIRNGLPSLQPSQMSGHHELRDGAGSVYTKMRPVFHAGYNDGRRKSDFYSFSANYGGFYKTGPAPGHSEKADMQTSADNSQSRISIGDESCSGSLQQSCSVSDRINHMERLTRVSSPATNNVSTRDKVPTGDDFHLSKSVPNLLSENDVQYGQKDCSVTDGTIPSETEPSFTYLDPEKKLKVTDNTLKLIQKQAVLDYYTRQKKSSTDLTKDTRKTSLNRSEDNEDSKNSSFESERRFIRSVSQGSLAGLSYPNSESYISTKGSPDSLSKQQKSPGTRFAPPTCLDTIQQDVSLRLQAVQNNDSPDTGAPHWQETRGDTSVSDVRTPSPELPPPPPHNDQEVLVNDTPLPPPPLRIEESHDSDKLTSDNGKTRTSPATIAAKGAPGWERFLGVSTSSVTFTSDEARKFRRTKDRHRARAHDHGPKSLPFNFAKDGLKPLQPAKSSPSLSDKNPVNNVNNKHWWKTSMDSLRMNGGAGGDNRPQLLNHGDNVCKDQVSGVVSHSHSSSDSGLSSLSGRTSCMSPLSVVSTGSSASSGSSRASLRSASIVSSSTIPLDEDDERDLATSTMTTVRRNMVNCYRPSEDQDNDIIVKTAAELFALVSVQPNIMSSFGSELQHHRIMAQHLKGVFNWEMEQLHDFQKSDFSHHLDQQIGNHTGSGVILDQGQNLHIATAKKSELEAYIRKRLSSLKAEEAIFKEKEKKNLDVGKFLLKRLQVEARPNEVDKYKLHVEEVDKVASLLLGLTSRLARSEIGLINLKKNWNEDEEEAMKNKRDKLMDQLSEAKSLHASIEKRGTSVTTMLRQYLTEAEFEQFTTYMRTKSMLLLQTKILSEKQSNTQIQLDTISLLKI